MTLGRASLGVSLLLLGCAEPMEMAIAEQAVAYGYRSGSDDDAVLGITSPSVRCSASLVAPNLVLTARHCIAVSDPAAHVVCNPDGTSVSGLGLIARDYEPSQIVISAAVGECSDMSVRAKKLLSTGSQTECINDLALVILDAPLDGLPILPLRLTRPTSIGEKMSVVGYGVTEDAGALAYRKRRDNVEVLAIGKNRFGANGGQTAPGTFVLGRGPCQGDSGGPAISNDTGAITGVYSIAATESCTDQSATGIYAQVAEYQDLILDAFDEAGAEPWFEGEPMPSSRLPSNRGCCVGVGMTSAQTTSLAAFLIPLVAFGGLRRRRSVRQNFAGQRCGMSDVSP